MNYFAHGYRFLSDPYFVAGTALPDWLSVVDRRVRVRSRHARLLVDHADPRVVSLAHGVLQHHRDDAWFHETRAFAELSLQLTREVRAVLPDEAGFRPSFLGHILVEILLDAELIAQQPERLKAYYQTVESIEPELVAAAVAEVAVRPAEGLAWFIPRFSSERFLSDYASDAKLVFRLNQVMRRVKLLPLPSAFADLLPEARRLVRARVDDLLPTSWRTDHENWDERAAVDG